MINSKQVAVISDKLYNYIVYKKSLSHGVFDEKKYTSIEAWKMLCKMFKQYKVVYKSCRIRVGICALRGARLVIDTWHSQSKELVSSLYNKLIFDCRKNLFAILFSELPVKEKVASLLFCAFPKIYKKSFKLRHKNIN